MWGDNDSDIIWYENTEYISLLGNSPSNYPEHRTVFISPKNDPNTSEFPHNRITTNKYTLWNFLPKNLFEQFRRVANFYFLITAIIAFAIESPISPLTSTPALVFVIVVTAGKQGYEDWLRHRSDVRVNRALVTVIRNTSTQSIHCEKLVVGDLVKVNCNDEVPCDLVLLCSSDPTGCCYVTTSNLDGETNLKTLQVPRVVSSLPVSKIVSMEATVTCEHPLADLYRFHGKLEIKNGTETTSGFLTIENILLRGARIKDTAHVIGCAVYTGQDTKLSLNSKVTINKFSTAERSINTYLIIFIIVLVIVVVLSTVMKSVIELNSSWSGYLGEADAITVQSLVINVLSFVVLYNYIVPISLYVTAEMQKFVSSLFFAWDNDMYDKESDQSALANTSDLNEELGQVEYLFSDKTGTLTENLMVFRRCSIDGNAYMEKDCDGNLYLLPPSGNEKEAVKLTAWRPVIWHFMIGISLCNVVHIAPPSQRASIVARRSFFRKSFREKKTSVINSSLLMHPDLPEYQAASADEKALVEASARCGVVFHKNSGDVVEIRIKNDTLKFKKLDTFEFTSERKRMSVIVQDAAGDIWLYCKGADSSVCPLIDNGKLAETYEHLTDFSMRGLRTLVIAYKKLKKSDYERLMISVERAREIIGSERVAHVERCYRSIENGLTLLGVSAVEDRLQEGVQETLESLRAAGIKVWVLTGDKGETAENIAYLCGHFKKGSEILRLMGHMYSESCFVALTSFQRMIKLEPFKQFGIIIDGVSMEIACREYPSLLRTVTMACESVVCCRLSPLQKCEMVQIVKQSEERPITAAIGDGGNDVSMIQEAHVGIGIMGKEGRQATMSADFAFAKFRFLRKALLVHGHWYYVRISVLIQYFFYKNLLLVAPQLYFAIHSGFAAQLLFDSVFLMCYNVFFTSIPILIYGLLEQDYSAHVLLKYPQLYRLYKKNYLLSSKQFIIWTISGIWHASVAYFVPYFCLYINPVILHDNTPADHWSYSTLIHYIIVIVCNIKLLLCSAYWTLPFVLTVTLSILSFILIALIYSTITTRFDGDMIWVMHSLLASLTFWLLTTFSIIMCLLPDCLVALYNRYRPHRVGRKIISRTDRTAANNLSDNNSNNEHATANSVLITDQLLIAESESFL
ncbi:phospholipid-transporting ATPase IF-like isoform X2 [Athalia rosae]|uniref:phospholipid-transporting ATPase IF-like isoform X2 n=1 Tax=Athalia rosae TaxID=37344 RepID=UPI002033E0B5|nr:phospholipid-transporting ATPase IF-like isoform X2 [Athalia rosae]